MRRPALTLACLLLPLAAGAAAEDRRILDAEAPAALQAVGRLEIPTSRFEEGRRRHYNEACSGTLLAPVAGSEADLVVTAWHCLEYYTDLSRDLRFGLRDRGGALQWRRARHIASGGTMSEDWALLRLRPALPLDRHGAAVLAPRAARADDRLAMAGFSRDAGLGAGGERLTYDPGCRLTGRDGADLLTDCEAYKGASGGAVFLDGALVGVVSRGDGAGRSVYVPARRFSARLRSLLR